MSNKKKINDYTVYDFGITPSNIESYNTNNGWGFGGSRGLEYTFHPRLTCKIGLAGTRHRGEFPHVTIWFDEDGDKFFTRQFDEDDTPTQRRKATEKIQQLLKDIELQELREKVKTNEISNNEREVTSSTSA